MIKKIFILTVSICFLSELYAHAAQQGATENLVRQISPPIEVLEKKPAAKDRFYANAFLETSSVLQGTRWGRWDELTTVIGYAHQNITSYLSVSQLERFDEKDITYNVGSYLSMKDSYAHLEIAFGQEVSYMYKLQTISEYGHRLYETLFWQLGYCYKAYGLDDTHIIYPGLIYYFGDSYMSVDYGVAPMEGHDTANFGVAKGDFAITKFLNLWCGTAFGERLYDINGFDAAAEQGYILFAGVTITVYKELRFRAGYSYGTEEPKFIKRSINFGLSGKF